MTDSLETLSSYSEEERENLLKWYKTLPESEEALDELTQTPTRSGNRLWTDSEELVRAVDSLLWSIMGDASPYQFANYRMLYEAYRTLQDQHAPYSEYLGAQYFQFFVRKWIIKNNRQWQDKNRTSRNRISLRFPNGYQLPAAGFGKRRLMDGERISTNLIPLETAWNHLAYYEKQPAFAGIK